MLTYSVIDANTPINRGGSPCSLVAGWLRYELRKANLAEVPREQADALFLCYAGSMDWYPSVRRAMRGGRADAIRIAGGAVAATPFAAMALADALIVGEGYRSVRDMFEARSTGELLERLRNNPHAILREDMPQERDGVLLAREPGRKALPDTWIDWDVPVFRPADHVARLVVSKGCLRKCAFCATTYLQPYQYDERGDRVAALAQELTRRGERVSLMSNDPAALPYFHRIGAKLDSESFTIFQMRRPENRSALVRTRVGVARLGVEGVSERIRAAFGKPVSNDEVLEIVSWITSRKRTCHLFFIAGAPFETGDDWEELRGLFYRLSRTVTSGLLRVKFTAFVPTPPAPLARFAPSDYDEHVAEFKRWLFGTSACRHMLVVWPRKHKRNIADVCQQWGVPSVAPGVLDIAPTQEQQRRAPWELVEWPIGPEKRWAIAEAYRRRMLGLTRRGASDPTPTLQNSEQNDGTA